MSNSNKMFLYLIGLVFMIAGIASALEMVNISFSSIVLLIIGIIFIFIYKKINNNIFKYLSCFFIPIGVSYFIISSFHITDSMNFLLIYSSLACAFLCLYFATKHKLFLFVSLMIIMFALHVFTSALPNISEFVIGYDCFYIAVLCVIVFIFEYKNFGYIPIIVSFFTFLCGTLNLLASNNLISPIMYKFLISFVFVLIGVIIIAYSFKTTKNEKKENLHEQTN